jgi:hypothetical protein
MIVEKADQVRFPAEGFQVDVTITTLDNGAEAPTCASTVSSPRATPTAS